MKIFKRILLFFSILLISIASFFGYKIGSKYYSSYQSEQQLTNTVLDIPFTSEDLLKAKSLQQGEIYSKKLIDLSTIKPLWKNISEDGVLKPSYEYLSKINFYVISYKSDDQLINGIIAKPKKSGNFPLIIFNRGGNKEIGKVAKAKTLFSMVYVSSKLVHEGYIVLASCYRENDEFGGSDLKDVLVLNETAKTINNVDTSKIGMFGWSRGGMMTYLALRESNFIKTAVIGCGPTNLFSIIEERPSMESNVYAKLMPSYDSNKEAALKDRSAIFWADKLDKNSSLLLLSGTQDKKVNSQQTDDMAEALEMINYDFEHHQFETNHTFDGKKQELNALLVRWFNEKL